jgi:hypothetical protein
MVGAMISVMLVRSSNRGTGWWYIIALLCIPVAMALFVAVRGRHANEQLVSALFVASIASNQLPRSAIALASAVAAALFSLATRPAPLAAGSAQDEKRGDDERHSKKSTMNIKTKAVLACLFMIAVMLHENFMIWVVSATFVSSHEPPYPDPLQDNGRIVLRRLAQLASLSRQDVQALRDTFNVQWALVASAMGAFVACELRLGRAAKRTMWAVAARALLTLGVARFVRTVSFLLTVLPSQMPACYRSHFPYPVPDTWSEWIKVGLKPAARGGCNDLIISGHATVTSILACIGVSVAHNPTFSAALGSLLVFDYLIEVYQGYHYSVDMWMGGLVTSLIFCSLAWVEPADGEERGTAPTKSLPLRSSSLRDVVTYGAPSIAAFLIISLSSEAIGLFWIVAYAVAAAVAHVQGSPHLSRHIFICTLYIALIILL